MAGSRARRVHAFATQQSKQYGVPFEAVFDGGSNWHLSWTDGPSRATVLAQAATTDLDGARLGTSRNASPRAIALTAIRMAAAGRLDRSTGYGYRSGPQDAVESQLSDINFPDRPDDDWHAVLADRLLALATATSTAAWQQYRAARGPAPQVPLDVDGTTATLLRDRGLGWLVEDAAAGTAVPPLLLLSARYAPHAGTEPARAWRDRAQPLPIAVAVAAAVADDHLDRRAAAALLAVLPELRAEYARTEAAAVAAARRAGVTCPPRAGSHPDASTQATTGGAR